MTAKKPLIIKTCQLSAIFTAGGVLYGALELLWRRHTHWTMLLAGGTCSVLLYLIDTMSAEPIWKKALMGGAVITTVEFLTGIAVNIVLDYDVWSYDGHAGNLFGQICPAFSLCWVLLSFPAIGLMRLVRRAVFKDGKKGEAHA